MMALRLTRAGGRDCACVWTRRGAGHSRGVRRAGPAVSSRIREGRVGLGSLSCLGGPGRRDSSERRRGTGPRRPPFGRRGPPESPSRIRPPHRGSASPSRIRPPHRGSASPSRIRQPHRGSGLLIEDPAASSRIRVPIEDPAASSRIRLPIEDPASSSRIRQPHRGSGPPIEDPRPHRGSGLLIEDPRPHRGSVRQSAPIASATVFGGRARPGEPNMSRRRPRPTARSGDMSPRSPHRGSGRLIEDPAASSRIRSQNRSDRLGDVHGL